MVSSRDEFKYGSPQMILLHNEPQIKYPTEVLACAHGYNPSDSRFTPAPPSKRKKIVPVSMRPDVAWCTACRDWHDVSCFHKDSTRPSGLQSYCKDYRAAYRKVQPEKKQVSFNWTRATPKRVVTQK